MAKFLNAVLFNPTAGGTTDFTVSAAVTGYMTPNAAGASNGAVYRYRAENATLTEWEIGYGTYNTGTGVLTRTVVLYNSLGTTAKINFTGAPNVGMGMPLAVDIFPFISDTPPSDPADGALWWESDTGILYIYYNDGSSSQWVGIQSQTNIAAVLYTAQSLTKAQQQQARANLGVALKNYIINGAMMVSQENGATAGTTAGYYPVDQFNYDASHGGAVSVAQVASATPGGSPNRLRVTVTTADASVAAGDYVQLPQPIEGLRVADLRFGSSSAKAIILQFGVRAPAGTYCVSFRNGAFNRTYIAEFTISAGEANTDVVKSVVVPGDVTGTWPSDNSRAITIAWCLMAGTTYQTSAGAWTAGNFLGSANQFNLMGTLSNVFELFDVGLYEGSVAPAFTVPDFPSELELCKRYWEKSYAYATALGTAVAGVGMQVNVASGLASLTYTPQTRVQFGVAKRVAPTCTTYSYQTGASGKINDATSGTDLNSSIDLVSEQSARVYGTTPTQTSYNIFFHWKADARM